MWVVVFALDHVVRGARLQNFHVTWLSLRLDDVLHCDLGRVEGLHFARVHHLALVGGGSLTVSVSLLRVARGLVVSRGQLDTRLIGVAPLGAPLELLVRLLLGHRCEGLTTLRGQDISVHLLGGNR